MPMSWTADADAKLLAAILAVHDIKPNYAAIAQRMGPECTAKALTHRIGIIKKIAQAADEVDGLNTSTPKTPIKRIRQSKAKDEDEGSVTKKTKITPSPAKTKMQPSAGPLSFAGVHIKKERDLAKEQEDRSETEDASD